MTTQDLINYYANLLTLQYVGKPKAYATVQALVTPVLMLQTSVQAITFSSVPASGAFTLGYNGVDTASINWNDSTATIQTKLQAVAGLGSVMVSGALSLAMLTVTFTGVTAPALLLTVDSNTLQNSGSIAVSPVVAIVDQILPLAVQNAFTVANAVGVQLDIIGKYVGISRNGFNFSGAVTLSDSDYRLVLFAVIVRNSLKSNLAAIQSFLGSYFQGFIQVFDSTVMQMSYFYNAASGTNNVAEFFVMSGRLPRPMGVQLSATTYNFPKKNFFAMRTYLYGVTGSPFNSYTSYNLNTTWLSYQNAITI